MLQGKYKVYNLCSERLYDASLFEGKVWAAYKLMSLFCHHQKLIYLTGNPLTYKPFPSAASVSFTQF
jgi:hypothetical protein